ncbi:hypothetical protein P7K49_034702 [Saguinus oedipus]|uniref:Uncharacterized protein n=1 Tax=Saguinus oedipus TaxID=9490 RepID=A0ABQ9TWC8_SAGOE|nr:hypothetical protein P7K49_034702 [Saguinus oedipus]
MRTLPRTVPHSLPSAPYLTSHVTLRKAMAVRTTEAPPHGSEAESSFTNQQKPSTRVVLPPAAEVRHSQLTADTHVTDRGPRPDLTAMRRA